MESCFILSLVLSFAFTVFNASGRYLLVEVGAEMETIPRTLDNGKHIAFKSFAHYFYFHQVIFLLYQCFILKDFLVVTM